MKTYFIIVMLICACQVKTNVNSEINNQANEKINVNIKASNEKFSILDKKLLIEYDKMENEYNYSVYSMKLYSDGNISVEVRKDGKTNTTKHKIKVSEVEKLIAGVNNANFFQLSDRYVNGKNCERIITHKQTVSISVYNSSDNSIKKINHYLGCEGTIETEKLFMLEKTLEDIYELVKAAN
jgi:hypothetical protein